MFAIKIIAAHARRIRASALFGLFFASCSAFAALPIQNWTQASGARVYLVESHAIPMVDVQLDFDAGGRRDAPAKAGLAAITASMTGHGLLARGGAPALDENQLSEAWVDLGASFGGSAGSDRMSYQLRSLSYPDLLPRAAQLAARQLGEPAFPANIWQRDRERMSAAIREANTRPATLAQRAFDAAVYRGHPYGFETTEATLKNIEVADMRQLHAGALRACRAVVSIVGDVTRAQADTLVATLLARLPAGAAGAGCDALPPVADVTPLAAPVTEAIAFESAQAHVLIGQPGYKRDDPDYFALLVGNYILGGGGFVSRLTSEVREKRGLSYSVYSYFAPGLHAGAFTVGLQTRPDQAAQAVQVSQGVLARFVADGPTEAELQAARDNLVGGFALRIDSNRKLLDNVASIAWNRLPLDYLDGWTRQIERVTVGQIKDAFARKLQPERMVTVTVGAGVARSPQ